MITQPIKRGPEACILCGLCNAGGDAYKLALDERRSPRHLVWSCRKEITGQTLYATTVNGRAEALCPINIAIDDTIIAARRHMVRNGEQTMANKIFIAKIKEGKNPYKQS